MSSDVQEWTEVFDQVTFPEGKGFVFLYGDFAPQLRALAREVQAGALDVRTAVEAVIVGTGRWVSDRLMEPVNPARLERWLEDPASIIGEEKLKERLHRRRVLQ